MPSMLPCAHADIVSPIFCAQDLDLNIELDLDLVDVDDVASPTIKLSDAKYHVSLVSSLLLENSLYFGVNEIIGFKS